MKNDKEFSQYEKIIAIMLRNKDTKTKWHALDFMQSHLGELFVGYKASTRVCELVNEYTEIFGSEDDPDSKYQWYFMKFENKKHWLDRQSLPFREVLIKEMSNVGLLEIDIFYL